MELIITDSQLETIESITERINSIDSQFDKLENMNPDRIKDFDKYHAKFKKLTERKDRLWIRRAILLKNN
jgi:chromosome segregation ATPase